MKFTTRTALPSLIWARISRRGSLEKYAAVQPEEFRGAGKALAEHIHEQDETDQWADPKILFHQGTVVVTCPKHGAVYTMGVQRGSRGPLSRSMFLMGESVSAFDYSPILGDIEWKEGMLP